MFGFVTKLFSKKNTQIDPMEILDKYGQVLESGMPPIDGVCDSNILPYPKNVIRKAILDYMAIEQNDAVIKQLATSYYLLASFQDNAGVKSFLPPYEEIKKALDAGDKQKASEMMKNHEILQSTFRDIKDKISLEQNDLLKDLEAFDRSRGYPKAT